MESVKIYLITLAMAVAIQIVGALGIFFAFGFVLSKIQRWTHKQYAQSIGWKGILWTAWIGTPVHELGHAFFAKLFRHKIYEISLFKPNKVTGNLGHVNHGYSKKSGYQKIGNFFIGAAPMICGSVILAALLYFLLPNGREILAPLTGEFTGVAQIINSIRDTLTQLFEPNNLKLWQFWIFLYVSFCISSHIAPSKEDRKNMWKGFFWLVFLLALINGITLLFKVEITSHILKINRYLGILTTLFIYTIIISTIHLILASILLFPFRRKVYKC